MTRAVISTLLMLVLCCARACPARSDSTTGVVIVHVSSDARPVPDVAVRCDSVRARTDEKGAASLVLHVGQRSITVTRLGFARESLQVVVAEQPTEVAVGLKESVMELSEVVVTSTRTQRRIADEPTRVEVTARDDIEEQVASSPGNVAELLTEAGGVRVQQTSAGAGGASVRIRGLSGRYTKILSDGLPLFGLSMQGLSPLQIPPIDLERVEVIKGVASALYGPTALGGVVNLVSAQPDSRRQILLSQTSREGTNASVWDARRLNERWGYTLLLGEDRQFKQDVDGDGWADLPAHQRFVARPRVSWSGPRGDSWFMTGGVTVEDRAGGTVSGGHVASGESFRDELDTRRGDAGSVARIHAGPATISLLGSLTDESRTRRFGPARERDNRRTLFGEAQVMAPRRTQVLVVGASIERDAYRAHDLAQLDYAYLTAGLFVEDLWSPARRFSMSSSARADFHSVYGNFVSPRIAMLFKPGHALNVRVAAGGGAFTPTPFTEETEALGLAHLRPISLRPERARSASVDADETLGGLEFDASCHQSVVDQPVALRAAAGAPGTLELVNAAGPTRVDGIELFARRRAEPLSVTLSYALLRGSAIDVEESMRHEISLNPRHTAGLTVVWEEEDDTRLGLEIYYTGRQALAGDPYRTTSAPIAFVDGVVQQRFGSIVMFLHGENLNDVRQTRFDPLLRPTPALGGRWTTDVWAPLEGRVINLGLKWMY